MDSWTNILGSDYTYPKDQHNTQLWYVKNAVGKDKNFDDFKNMGGWTKPSIKMFSLFESVCGVNLDLNYIESPTTIIP